MTEKTQPTDAEIEALGHRMCWRYKHDTGVNHISTFTFNAQTLRDFARAVLVKWSQPAHSGEPVYAFRRRWQDDFCTCTEKRYAELSDKPTLFETRIFYTAPQPVEREPLSHAQAKALVRLHGCWRRPPLRHVLV